MRALLGALWRRRGVSTQWAAIAVSLVVGFQSPESAIRSLAPDVAQTRTAVAEQIEILDDLLRRYHARIVALEGRLQRIEQERGWSPPKPAPQPPELERLRELRRHIGDEAAPTPPPP